MADVANPTRALGFLAASSRAGPALLAAGIFGGVLVPPVARLMHPAIAPGVVGLMTLVLPRVDIAGAFAHLRRPLRVGAIVAFLLLACPLLGAGRRGIFHRRRRVHGPAGADRRPAPAARPGGGRGGRLAPGDLRIGRYGRPDCAHPGRPDLGRPSPVGGVRGRFRPERVDRGHLRLDGPPRRLPSRADERQPQHSAVPRSSADRRRSPVGAVLRPLPVPSAHEPVHAAGLSIVAGATSKPYRIIKKRCRMRLH